MSVFCPVLTPGALTRYVFLPADSDVLDVESKHCRSDLVDRLRIWQSIISVIGDTRSGPGPVLGSDLRYFSYHSIATRVLRRWLSWTWVCYSKAIYTFYCMLTHLSDTESSLLHCWYKFPVLDIRATFFDNWKSSICHSVQSAGCTVWFMRNYLRLLATECVINSVSCRLFYVSYGLNSYLLRQR
jgi:hypothetical protein